jgi:hypothetical protein
MKKPWVFIQIKNRGKELNTVDAALRQVAGALCDASIVDKLVDGEGEADIAIVASIEDAQRAIGETIDTRIILLYIVDDRRREEAIRFAARYPDRVCVASVMGDQHAKSVVTMLGEVADKLKARAGAAP